jgi:hypothetical protein
MKKMDKILKIMDSMRNLIDRFFWLTNLKESVIIDGMKG